MRIPLFVLAAFAIVTILITGFWDTVSSVVLPHTTWGLYSKSFFEGVLGNAHGGIIDILLVSVILYWFDRRRTAKEDIARHEQTLSDLKLYRANDASYHVLGTIRRLLALGVKKLQLSELSLTGVEIKEIEFSDSNFHATIFTDSHLSHVIFDRCDCEAAIFAGAKFEHINLKNSNFRRAKFQDATLKGVDFTTCIIEGSNFTNANLRSANFRGVDCRGVDFKNADLQSANFLEALNLSPQMIASAKNIKSLKSKDPGIKALVDAVK